MRSARCEPVVKSGGRSRSIVALVLLLAAAPPVLDGCMFRGLRKDIERLGAMSLIGGHMAVPEQESAPVVVVLSSIEPLAVVDTFVLDRPGPYYFPVQEGIYRIAAFVDRNRDLTYQPGVEPATSYGTPTAIRATAGQRVTGVDMEIRPESTLHLDSYIAEGPLGQRRHDLPDIQLGTVTSLDDPRFSAANGNLGLWEPIEFLFHVGAGFYFLEPFDPHKMPVLFVHGAGGQPGNWRYLVEHLDRSKFQPWFLYYPSGLDLETIAAATTRWMMALSEHYDVERVAVVAHSMGGVVSRAAINRVVANSGGKRLALFITMSTPWEGHPAAAAGAEHSPVVMPMWRDMTPGSPFLSELFRTPLPAHCPHYLLFSYRGKSMFLSEPNDGTVAVASELAWSAQQGAAKVYGFSEDHDGILTNVDASATLNKLLDDLIR